MQPSGPVYPHVIVDQFDKIPLANLRMVEVQHQPQVRAIDCGHQREGIDSLRKRGTGMINSSEDHLRKCGKREIGDHHANVRS
jgi:hypothetical protein